MEKAKKPQLKKIRELLKERSARDKEGVFVAEGAKIVLDALNKRRDVVSVFVSGRVVGAPMVREIISLCMENKVRLWRTAAAEFEKLSSLSNSQGILAVIKMPEKNSSLKGKLIVLCDGIQDPGNLGTIIRTSAAFGISTVFVFGAAADIYNPKVVRSSSGTVMDVNPLSVKEEGLDELKTRGFYLVSGTSERSGAKEMFAVELPESPVILAFGSEGRGLSEAVTKRSDDVFYIPMAPAAESLNVTAAAAIAIHYFSNKKGSNV
ncbi:MAG: RNA methyltransferase [Candidatus Omnitrophota bacterium]